MVEFSSKSDEMGSWPMALADGISNVPRDLVAWSLLSRCCSSAEWADDFPRRNPWLAEDSRCTACLRRDLTKQACGRRFRPCQSVRGRCFSSHEQTGSSGASSRYDEAMHGRVEA